MHSKILSIYIYAIARKASGTAHSRPLLHSGKTNRSAHVSDPGGGEYVTYDKSTFLH
jgi:hypothetical protein